MAKILYLDIETTGTLGYSFQKYEGTMYRVKEDSFMLSFAYKWEDEKKIKYLDLTDFSLYKKEPHNDLELIKELHKILDKADMVIGHNIDRFDIRKSNTEIVRHRLTPPSPYKTRDTLKIARRYFAFFGNSLNDLARFFGLKPKLENHGVQDKCIEGDLKAFKELKRYNIQDVQVLIEVYEILRPWITNPHPVSPENGLEACKVCGSTHVQKRGSERLVGGNKKPKYQCQNCGHWFTGPLQKVKVCGKI